MMAFQGGVAVATHYDTFVEFRFDILKGHVGSNGGSNLEFFGRPVQMMEIKLARHRAGESTAATHASQVLQTK